MNVRRIVRFRNRVKSLGVVSAAAIIVAVLSAISSPGIAGAATPPPSSTPYSYYAVDGSTSTAYTLGCNQGTSDKTSGNNSSTILDFFSQNSTGTGTYEDFTSAIFISNANIEAMAEQFALGYYVCTGTDTTTTNSLAIGTSNDGSGQNSTAGAAWAGVVNTVSAWVSTNNVHQVAVLGGNDIESWGGTGTYSGTSSWISGYSSAAHSLYYDYGSADGCPGTTYNNGACSSSWNQYDYWNVSWGDVWGLAVPETYYNPVPSNPINTQQWSEISSYGSVYQGSKIYFTAPLTEHLRVSGTLTSSQAWNDLETYNSEPSGFAFNMQFAAGYI